MRHLALRSRERSHNQSPGREPHVTSSQDRQTAQHRVPARDRLREDHGIRERDRERVPRRCRRAPHALSSGGNVAQERRADLQTRRGEASSNRTPWDCRSGSRQVPQLLVPEARDASPHHRRLK